MSPESRAALGRYSAPSPQEEPEVHGEHSAASLLAPHSSLVEPTKIPTTQGDALFFFPPARAGPGYSVTIILTRHWAYARWAAHLGLVSDGSLPASVKRGSRLARALAVPKGHASVKDKKREDARSVFGPVA